MKATLVFELPEETEEHKMAVHARDYYSALWQIYQELRQEYKHGEHECVRLEHVYDRFFEILDDNDVRLL